MAIGSAVGSAWVAGERTAAHHHFTAGVANQGFPPIRQHSVARVVAPVHPQMPDWLSVLPDVTRGNAHLLTIWPALDYVDDDENDQ